MKVLLLVLASLVVSGLATDPYKFNLTSAAFTLTSLEMSSSADNTWAPGAIATIVIKGSTAKMLTAGTVRSKVYELGKQHFISQDPQEYFSCNNKGCDKTQPIALVLADPTQKAETTFALTTTFTMPAKQGSGDFTLEIWGVDQDHQPYDFEVSLAYKVRDAPTPDDKLDCTKIPCTKITGGWDGEGVMLPMAGLGTWQYNDSVAEAAVTQALAHGYTHIDTAFDYGNSKGIGKAILASKRPRSSFFITTKVEGGLNMSRTMQEHYMNLQDLGLDYVDLLLIHFPATMCANPVGSRATRQAQWLAMESLVAARKARAIGVSHFCERQLTDVLASATIMPAVNQVEFHLGMGTAGPNATDGRKFMTSKGVLFQSFSPLCGPCGAANHLSLIEGPLVTSIGKKYGKSGAQISLKWIAQQGIPVIPKAQQLSFQLENIDIFDFTLSDAEMAQLTSAVSPPVTGGGDNVTSGDCGIP